MLAVFLCRHCGQLTIGAARDGRASSSTSAEALGSP
jgi:hypothetical protein